MKNKQITAIDQEATVRYSVYKAFQVSVQHAVAYVSFNNPPMNVLDATMMLDLAAFAEAVQADDTLKVIVFQSADSDYFIAHGDMNYIVDPSSFAGLVDPAKMDPLINPMQQLHEKISQLPQATIAIIDGFVRGGGHEFAQACDMRFASLEKAKIAQPEAMMGIIPGGGGTQYLTRRIGRARTLELVLGAELLDAKTAELYGVVNRALPQDQLYTYVETLATRIAGLPAGVAAGAKKAVDAANGDRYEGLATENKLCMDLFLRPETVQLAKVALAAGAQTREGERDLEGIMNSL
ncbi:enoyl-CoA hydratase/isomerase family protein [Chitinophaga pinensis]|uniref:Enoyl-CoA hydratase/isomerase n=1 Tax=Chitinophaga pinensis (strain ATCC 43595 / DSM 2588 / LMG 13176 / NBRC 15968 / NCIMB 11800 / UQM 2034) TaxID=485918 RepID=A0A979H0K6_CHIPD|nr:enoyl-CoA hydratase/isomerase family protein [Chitinophaga pinensis]ACU63545.1 Enoyl-CoA hydratase/isomerase [Chitinophaga pinensis DSM 2588]